MASFTPQKAKKVSPAVIFYQVQAAAEGIVGFITGNSLTLTFEIL